MADRSTAAAPAGSASILAALFLLAGMHQLATGLLMGVVPVQLSLSGFAATVVGWVSTAQSVGFLFGSLLAAPLIAAIGSARIALGIFACVNAASAAALLVTDDPFLWAAVRTVSGFSSACAIVLFEAWFASNATPARRGLVFGMYMALTRAAFMVAQISMAFVEPRLSLLFVAGAAIYLCVPSLSLAVKGDAPAIGRRAISGRIWDMPLRAPAAAAGCLTHALVTTAGASLFPVYAVARGVPVDKIAVLLAAMQFGGLAMQLPLSFLSDKIGRRTVMLGAAVAAAMLSSLLWFVEAPGVWTLAVLAALWAGAPAPLYSLAVAHANDIAHDDERISWSSAMLVLWGTGATIGPIAASILMDRTGSGALFAFTGILSAALALFLLLRKLIRKRPLAPVPATETIGPAPGGGG